MALYPSYVTSNEYKDFVHVDTADTADDTEINLAIAAASRAIDSYCNRQFGQITSATTRYFEAESRNYVKIFDLYTTTQLTVALDLDNDGVFEETLTLDTDFRLVPRNAPGDLEPWTGIELIPGGTYAFPHYPYYLAHYPCTLVEVSARWGWTAVPDSVKQATLLQADVFMKRRQAGLAGDYSSTSRFVDRDVQLILKPFRRWYGAV